MTTQTQTPQWHLVARLLGRYAVQALLISTVTALAFIGASYVVGRWLGWSFVEVGEDRFTLGIVADDGDVTVDGVFLAFPLALSIAAIGLAIVLPAICSRVFISTGVTRQALAAGTGAVLAGVYLYVAIVTALVLAVLEVSVTTAVLGWATGLALGMVGGLAITTLFLRWPWWVGVLALGVIFLVLPVVLGLTGVGAVSAGAEPWVNLLLLPAAAAGYGVMIRRLPVP